MVSTQIKTYAELEAIQRDPAQFTDWMTEIVAEKLGLTQDAIASTLQKAIAKSRLPGSLPMHGEVSGGLGGLRAHKHFERAAKAGYDVNEYVLAEYGGGRGEFETFGRFVSAVGSTNPNATKLQGLSSRVHLKGALAEAAGSLGGFLVPEEYRMQLRMLQLEQARFRGFSTVLPMSSMVEHWPYVRDTSHVSSVYGGVIGYWEPEAGTLTDSEPTFAMLTLTAHKLTAYTVASNEVLSDSGGAIESFINQQFPKALNWFEEHKFWNGNGAGSPMGILNAGALISTTRDTASHITYQDIVNMSTHFLPSSENNIVWFANPSVKADLYTMALNVGTGGAPIYVNPFNGSGAAGAPPNTLLGRPVYFTEHLPALGTKGDLVAVDLSYYLIGDRQSMSMVASPHVKFTSDQTVFRFIERLDGQPWLDSSLTLNDGTTTVSPFVCVAT